MPSDDDRQAENLRRWAKTDLRCYTVEGWDGERRWSSQSGIGSADGESITLSAGVALSRADGGCVEIVSHRQDDGQFRRLRAHAPMNSISVSLRDLSEPVDPARRAAIDQEISRLEHAARSDQLAWEGTVIEVDGRPTIFCVAHFGSYWTAVGRGSDVDLIVFGHDVELPSRLVQLGETPPPLKIRPPLPPRVRGRRFPDDALAPDAVGDLAGGANVDLVYYDGHLLAGTVAGTSVRLDVVVPAPDATASGSFADVDIHATWNLGSNSLTHPDVPGTLTGSYAGQPVTLDAVFHLDDDYVIDFATVSGDMAGELIAARLETADGGIGNTGGSVWVEGVFAGAEFSLFATIAHGWRAVVRGQVSGEPIALDAKRGPGQVVRVAGSYHGPRGLLAVVVVAVLHFL